MDVQLKNRLKALVSLAHALNKRDDLTVFVQEHQTILTTVINSVETLEATHSRTVAELSKHKQASVALKIAHTNAIAELEAHKKRLAHSQQQIGSIQTTVTTELITQQQQLAKTQQQVTEIEITHNQTVAELQVEKMKAQALEQELTKLKSGWAYKVTKIFNKKLW